MSGTLDIIILSRILDEAIIRRADLLTRVDGIGASILYGSNSITQDLFADLKFRYKGKITFHCDRSAGIDRVINQALKIGSSKYVTIMGDDEYDFDQLTALVRHLTVGQYGLYYLNSSSTRGEPSFNIRGPAILSPAELISEVQTDLGFVSSLVFERRLLTYIKAPDEIYGTNWMVFYVALRALERIQSVFMIRTPVFKTPMRDLSEPTWYDMPRTHSINFIKIFNSLNDSPYKPFLRKIIHRKVLLTFRYNIKARLVGGASGMGDKLSIDLKDVKLVICFSYRLLHYLVLLLLLNVLRK